VTVRVTGVRVLVREGPSSAHVRPYTFEDFNLMLLMVIVNRNFVQPCLLVQLLVSERKEYTDTDNSSRAELYGRITKTGFQGMKTGVIDEWVYASASGR
jgi:hypothetical protein